MSLPTLIVCEKRGAWAALLRPHLDAGRYRLVETRSSADCRSELAAHKSAVIVWELTAQSAPEVLEQLADLQVWQGRSVSIVFARRGLENLRWTLLEAGARHVEFSPRHAERVAGVIRRALEQLPQDPLSPGERIMANLPFSGLAGDKMTFNGA